MSGIRNEELSVDMSLFLIAAYNSIFLEFFFREPIDPERLTFTWVSTDFFIKDRCEIAVTGISPGDMGFVKRFQQKKPGMRSASSKNESPRTLQERFWRTLARRFTEHFDLPEGSVRMITEERPVPSLIVARRRVSSSARKRNPEECGVQNWLFPQVKT